MNKKLKITLIVIVSLVLIRLFIFPVYTRCSGNDCQVVHFNRLTGHAYYTNVKKQVRVLPKENKKEHKDCVNECYYKYSEEKVLTPGEYWECREVCDSKYMIYKWE